MLIAIALTVLIVAGMFGIGVLLGRVPRSPADPPFCELGDHEPPACRLEYAVCSGSGAGWGIYDDLGEAEARRGYVAMSHPNVRIFYRVKGAAS